MSTVPHSHSRVSASLNSDEARVQATLPTSVLYLRKRQSTERLEALKVIGRDRTAAMSMALVSMLLVVHRRVNYDSLLVIAFEFLVGAVLMLSVTRLSNRSNASTRESRGRSSADWLLALAGTAVLLWPWVSDAIARAFGFGNGLEIVMLASLGWLALLLAGLVKQLRSVGLSVVCSGFLTLFSTFIADSSDAIWLTIVWGVLCLWWLVSKQWEQVETIAAGRIQRTQAQRVGTVALACLVFLAGSLFVSNRIPVLRKLQAEIMPTSGGSRAKDSAARRGVGNGDALIAARKHATSFGAVETDVFLDSEKPSLFDVFSDEFGEPRKKDRVERAQALSPQELQNKGGNFTEANRASSSSEFSIERELPDEHKPLNDLIADSLMFWQGESGAHLAVQRYDQFSEGAWQTAAQGQTSDSQSGLGLAAVEIDSQTWFQRANLQVQNSISPFVDALPESLKFTRYRSPSIPTRSGLQLWCIDQINRADFFEVKVDECLEMRDREHVPDYTVVRMINSRIDLARLEGLVRNCSPGQSHRDWKDSCKSQLNQLAHRYASGTQRGWDQVEAIVSGLRREFTLDRLANAPTNAVSGEAESALAHFLDLRRGPDYMFATTAALMLDHLGYRTRLVSGFYVNPEHYVRHEGEFAILPRDVHAWLELNAGHGYWVPLEPTPGYRSPKYSVGFWYTVKRHASEIVIGVLGLFFVMWAICALRAVILEIFVFMLLPMRRLLNERRQIAWLVWLLDLRCQLAGLPRSLNVAPRQHLLAYKAALPSELEDGIREFFRGADQIYFGGCDRLSEGQRVALVAMWQKLTVRVLTHSRRKGKARWLAS